VSAYTEENSMGLKVYSCKYEVKEIAE
jgi:hypothetical protein